MSFCFRADASRKEFLATPCDRQPVAFSEEDPSSPKHDEGKIIFFDFLISSKFSITLSSLHSF